MNNMNNMNKVEERNVIIHRCSEEEIDKLFERIRMCPINKSDIVAVRYIKISDVIIKLIVYDRGLLNHLSRELAFTLYEDIPGHYDYTIISWVANQTSFNPVEHRVICKNDSTSSIPVIIKDETNGKITGYDHKNKSFYYCFPSSNPEVLSREGHVFFRQLYRAFKDKSSSTFVHGACVGVDGKGVLLCARGNRGKSTLSVLALLKGFEYVSDDYLIIEKEESELFASPIYSIMTLSPRMYNEMFDELDGSRFISNNWNNSKYILSVANHHDKFRVHYPIKVCMIPEIVQDSSPSISICTVQEKGKAICNIAHSTVIQMDDSGDKKNMLKILGFLKDQRYFKFNLCSDIHKNVECLRVFLKSLETTN